MLRSLLWGCCAHAVDKIATSVTETHQSSSAARPAPKILLDAFGRVFTAGDFPCLPEALNQY